MRVRFTGEATPTEREAVRQALESRGLAWTASNGTLRVDGIVDADALALAAMAGVAEVAPAQPSQGTRRDAILGFTCGASVVLGVLVLLAANLPPKLGAPADPLRTPEALRPSWPLTPWYAAVDQLPSWIPVPFLFLVAALVLFFWPNLARRFAEKHPVAHTLVGTLALAVVAGLAAVQVLR